jgi:23S rRNA pseudouridine1911/1915/1917 synthase
MPVLFKVTEPAELLRFLLTRMPDKSRTAVKSLLVHHLVSVDNAVVTQFNHGLTAGETVAVRRTGEAPSGLQRGLKIVFEDDALMVVEKRAGLLSIATDAEREKTAYSLLSDYVKRADSRNLIFVVHRLDRETSGLMMFAKNQAVQKALQQDWQEAVSERIYVAVVEGQVSSPQGTITSWLTENKALVMRSSSTPNDGQKATTSYRVLQTNPKYSLLELSLETGRKNQIRVHLQDLGHPIVGDKKYGATQNPIQRLGLHARVLAFRHPITGEVLRFESPVPKEFYQVFQPKRKPALSRR